jgi:spore germination protein GerM
MTRRAAAVLLVLLTAAVAGLVFLNRPRTASPGRRAFRPFFRVTPAPAPTAAAVMPGSAAPATTPHETVRLTLFFPDREDGKLRPEERDIPRPEGPGAFLKAIFVELQRGPRRPSLFNPIPEKMQLRNAFLLPDGVAVLDLAVDSGLAFGSDDELTIVAALVDTTLQNVAETNRVRILVNGEPAETLGGHLDLTRPLSYLRSEVAS